MIKRWESVYAYIAEIKASGCHMPATAHNGKDWDLGVSAQRGCEMAIEGDKSLASILTSAVDKLDANTVKQTFKPRCVPDFVGSRCSVPRYLSGVPNCMIRRKATESSVRHVAIYVDISSGAAIKADQLLVRGSTILALLESLRQRQIDVDLWLVCQTDGQTDGSLYQVIRIESKPLDLSTAGFAIAHPAFDRNVCMTYAKTLDGFQGSWPSGFSRDPLSPYQRKLRDILGMVDTDIYIPAVHQSDPIIVTPQKWLDAQLSTIEGVAA